MFISRVMVKQKNKKKLIYIMKGHGYATAKKN